MYWFFFFYTLLSDHFAKQCQDKSLEKMYIDFFTLHFIIRSFGKTMSVIWHISNESTYIVAVFDCVQRRRGTAGDERGGGVWPYSTESNSTQNTGYSLAQQQLLLIHCVVFIFKDCVGRADIFASPKKSA